MTNRYQCSPHSTSDSITFQYQKAVEYASSRGTDSITVLLLDEVGLAELSPDLPLKVRLLFSLFFFWFGNMRLFAQYVVDQKNVGAWSCYSTCAKSYGILM